MSLFKITNNDILACSKNFEVDDCAKPPKVRILGDNAKDTARYVEPISGKNVKYSYSDLLVLQGDDRTKCLNALRQRNRRRNIQGQSSQSERLVVTFSPFKY